jgi:hypothetical protein
MSPDEPSLPTEIQRDLVPVNAVIGFLKRDRKWPSALYELGYRLAMIEQPVSAGAVGTAEVDVICLNRRRNHGMLWECKSGRTIDERQARVYASISAEDVQRTGNVTFPYPASASVEPIYCCLKADATLLWMLLRSWDCGCPWSPSGNGRF